MTKPLVFIGTNNNLKIFTETAERQGFHVAGIIDDDYFGNTEYYNDIRVIGSHSQLLDPTEVENWIQKYEFFIATNWSNIPDHVRDTQKRQQQIDLCRQVGIQCVNLIDPNAYISKNCRLGKGIYIGPFCYVEPDCEIDDFAQIWYGTGISHGTRIGENSVLQRQCGISATVGRNVYISMWTKIYGSTMLTIGDNAVINPGLYVARNVAEGEIIRLTKNSRRIWQYPTEI